MTSETAQPMCDAHHACMFVCVCCFTFCVLTGRFVFSCSCGCARKIIDGAEARPFCRQQFNSLSRVFFNTTTHYSGSCWGWLLTGGHVCDLVEPPTDVRDSATDVWGTTRNKPTSPSATHAHLTQSPPQVCVCVYVCVRVCVCVCVWR